MLSSHDWIAYRTLAVFQVQTFLAMKEIKVTDQVRRTNTSVSCFVQLELCYCCMQHHLHFVNKDMMGVSF